MATTKNKANIFFIAGSSLNIGSTRKDTVPFRSLRIIIKKNIIIFNRKHVFSLHFRRDS